MNKQKLYILGALFVTAALVLGACGPSTTPEEPAEPAQPAETVKPAEPTVPAEPTEPVVEAPTSLKIAVVLAGTLEEPWYSTSIDSLNKLKENNDYGVDIEYVYSENIWGEDSLRVMREYAETGEYGIVWSCTGSDSEYIKQIQDEFPDVLFAHSGGGGEGLGKNSAWVWGLVHEPAYLLGMIAGMMTETNVIGMVGSFPSEEINQEVNAYIQGAKDVNPDVKAKVTFINSWYDPEKAKEAAVAQIAAGADFIYPTIYGAFEAMDEAGILGFGNYVDQHEMAPNVVVASTILSWDPPAKWMLDLWYKHATTGKPYDVQTTGYWGLMADGGSDIVLNEDMLPADVLAAVKAKQAEIISGAFVVPVDQSVPKSD